MNADLEAIALPYAAKVIRELFMNSAYAGSMGMSTVPLSELYAGVEPFVEERGGSVHLNTFLEGAAWNEAAAQWHIRTRTGELDFRFSGFSVAV